MFVFMISVPYMLHSDCNTFDLSIVHTEEGFSTQCLVEKKKQ